MLDGRLLVDAHVHVPVLGSLAPAWLDWARDFGPDGILEDLWDADGVPRPGRLDELFEEQGVDHALLFCEYSPKATGYQRFDDLLPLVERNPRPVPPGRQRQPAPALPDRRGGTAPARPRRGGAQAAPGARRLPLRRPGALPGLPGARRAGRAAGRALRHQHLPRLHERARRPGVPAAGRAGLPDPRRGARARRPRLVVRRGRVHGAVEPDRVDRAVGAAPQAAARVLPRATTWGGSPAAGSSPPTGPGSRAPPRTPAPWPASACPTTSRTPSSAATRCASTPASTPAEGDTVMTDDPTVPAGRPAAELSDEELESQGKQLHDTRNWMFLHGTAAPVRDPHPPDARPGAGVPAPVPQAHLAGPGQHRGRRRPGRRTRRRPGRRRLLQRVADAQAAGDKLELHPAWLASGGRAGHPGPALHRRGRCSPPRSRTGCSPTSAATRPSPPDSP